MGRMDQENKKKNRFNASRCVEVASILYKPTLGHLCDSRRMDEPRRVAARKRLARALKFVTRQQRTHDPAPYTPYPSICSARGSSFNPPLYKTSPTEDSYLFPTFTETLLGKIDSLEAERCAPFDFSFVRRTRQEYGNAVLRSRLKALASC